MSQGDGDDDNLLVNERTRLLDPPPSSSSEDPITTTTTTTLPKSEDPRSWSRPYRWLCIAIISSYGLMSPVLGAAIVPALPSIAADFDIPLSDKATLGSFISVYLLSWSTMPVILGPLSERYGRLPLLQGGHSLFLLLNVLCAFARNKTELLVLRFLAGGAGSGPLSIGAGIVSDLWSPSERGTSIALYTLGPLLGPAIGPIAAAYIVESLSSWRWIFGISAIFISVSLTLGFLFLRESYVPLLLRRHNDRNRRRKVISSEGEEGEEERVREREEEKKLPPLSKTLLRPFHLLLTQPIIYLLALYTAYLFGINHLTITTFDSVFLEIYHQSPLRASLNYFSIAAGFVTGSQVTGPINDGIYRYYSSKARGQPNPEIRILLTIPASLLSPAGLLIYGWAVESRWPFLVADLGIFLFSAGIIMSYQCVQAYVIDCYSPGGYAASSMSAMNLLRAVAGFVFPLLGGRIFGDDLDGGGAGKGGLGFGWGCTVLAGVAGVGGVLVPGLLAWWGPRFREGSRYIKGEI